MDGWTKIAAGVVLGVAGTVYATNRKFRDRLPERARDLPESVQRRFEGAVSAAREASASRREEILDELKKHSASHPPRETFIGEDISGEDLSDTDIDAAARENLKPEGPDAESESGVSSGASGDEEPPEPTRSPPPHTPQ